MTNIKYFYTLQMAPKQTEERFQTLPQKPPMNPYYNKQAIFNPNLSMGLSLP
jgi:hypothetical protein